MATQSDVKVNLDARGTSTRGAAIPGNIDRVMTESPVSVLFPSLSTLRQGIIPLVEAEQRKVQETRHLAYA